MSKNIILYMIFGMIMFLGCKDVNINSLELLDKDTRQLKVLNQFSSFEKTKTKINGIKVCNIEYAKCKSGEIDYKIILNRFEIPQDDFMVIHDRMIKLGLSSYYKYKDYSLWVSGGAMGEINGYLISNKIENEDMKSFRLDSYYYIEIGKKIKNGVYYFTGN